MNCAVESPLRSLLDMTSLTIIGGERNADGMPHPLEASSHTLFAPRSCLWHPNGSFWICDTGHHRVLGWPAIPEPGEPASYLLGQSDFNGESPNAGGEDASAGLYVPTGICALNEGIAVADAWNHRVLIWEQPCAGINPAPEQIIGQANASVGLANQGQQQPSADRLFWPYGLCFDGTHLWVADTGNRRVLRFAFGTSQANGLIGQSDFDCRDENAGAAPGPGSLRWPHALALQNEQLWVADAGNNRVLCFDRNRVEGLPEAITVLGQADPLSVQHNRGRMSAAADSLYMPYSLACAGPRLIVADTANSRLLAWDRPHAGDAPAEAIHGQASGTLSGDNRWAMPGADTLSWPYNISVCQRAGKDYLLIADTGNSRIVVGALAA